jgi:long-chain acyl-CoA synthetase
MPRPFSTLVELLDNAFADFPERELFGTKHPDGSWSWIHVREFYGLVKEARGGLVALGVQRGDRVGAVMDNRVEWAVMAFACYTLGACYVPMYEALESKEWKFILADCEAKVVVAATQEIFDTLKTFSADLPKLEHVVGLTLPAEHAESYAKLLQTGRESPAPAAEVRPEDLASFIYTSGTTGNPKGVMISHGNLSTNTVGAASRFSFTAEDRSLAFLPWAHAFGLVAELCTFLYVGASMAINDEVPQLINNLPVVRPTVLVAVPRIFNRIYDGVNKQMAARPAPLRKLFEAGLGAATKKNKGQALSFTERLSLKVADKLIFSKIRMKFGGRLRFVVSGSAALSTQVAEFIDALGIDVFEGYGLTETSPVVSVNYPGNRKIGSIGKPIPGVTVRIDTQVTGDPVNGEIIVAGPNVMRGYHNRPEENAQVFCEDGSFRTGDMGYVDSDGFLFITGRIKEQYKLETGKYVVPSPLEEQLKLSPLIANVMLHGANRPHNVALVVPDMASLEDVARKEGFALDNVANNPRVKVLLQAELDKYSAAFKGYERPKDLTITTEDFTIENGMLTPSLKLKRRNVLAKYEAQLEALY